MRSLNTIGEVTSLTPKYYILKKMSAIFLERTSPVTQPSIIIFLYILDFEVYGK